MTTAPFDDWISRFECVLVQSRHRQPISQLCRIRILTTVSRYCLAVRCLVQRYICYKAAYCHYYRKCTF